MEPRGRKWQELTWSWAYSTGNPASDQKFEAAAKAAWPYAMLCAWTYFKDQHVAHDLMDYAVQNASGYLGRHAACSDKTLLARIKSVIRRRARQEFAKHNREIPYGSLIDMEKLYVGQSGAEQRVYAIELYDRLSPIAQSITDSRSLGYSWRMIAEKFEMNHMAVQRAYFREVESLLHDSSQPGELFQCG